MNIDVYLQLVAISMAILGAVVSLYPPTQRRYKNLYFLLFVVLGMAAIFLVYRQSDETEMARKTAQEQQQVMQQKLDESLNQQRSLLEQKKSTEDQNRDLKARLDGIAKKIGAPAEFTREVTEHLQTQDTVGVTVGKGPSQKAQGVR